MGSASPYFKARCWDKNDNAEGQLQYANEPDDDGPPPPVRLLLVEHVEEEELPAMEAMLRYCYTEELCDVGGDASELSVALLVQMLVLSDRWA